MSAVEEDPVDAREIDKVITEVAGMAGRWAMFRKFLHERLKVIVSPCTFDSVLTMRHL